MLTDLCHEEKLILLTYEGLSVEFLWSSCPQITVFGPWCTMADIRSLEGSSRHYLHNPCSLKTVPDCLCNVSFQSGPNGDQNLCINNLKGNTWDKRRRKVKSEFLLVSKWASLVHNPCTLDIRHWICATYINRDHCGFRPFGKRRLKLWRPNLKIYSYNPDYFPVDESQQERGVLIWTVVPALHTRPNAVKGEALLFPSVFLTALTFNLFVCTTPGSCQHCKWKCWTNHRLISLSPQCAKI